jgi:hypothetical protein
MLIETKVIAAVVLTAVSTLTTTVATAAVVQFEGRSYEFVAASGITWEQANTQANARPAINGMPAHLATIATDAEDAFLSAQRELNVPTSGNQQVWVRLIDRISSDEIIRTLDSNLLAHSATDAG